MTVVPLWPILHSIPFSCPFQVFRAGPNVQRRESIGYVAHTCSTGRFALVTRVAILIHSIPEKFLRLRGPVEPPFGWEPRGDLISQVSGGGEHSAPGGGKYSSGGH